MRAHRISVWRPDRGVAIGLVALVAAIVLVLLLTERGVFRRAASAGLTALPGLTIDDTNEDAPVVTSIQSNSEAERRGIEVGDDIVAVDGRDVRSVDALREAVIDSPAGPLALHIRRGNAIWNVALDRTDGGLAATDGANGAQNPAG